MQNNDLSDYLAQLDSVQLTVWYNKSLIIARALRASAARRGRVTTDTSCEPVALPEPHEIIAETLVRIADCTEGKYARGINEHLGRYFARCLRVTLNALRSGERRHLENPSKFLDPSLDIHHGTPHADWHEWEATRMGRMDQRQGNRVLASVIAGTRMRGSAEAYVNRIVDFAANKLTAQEIASELNVKVGNVESIRRRVRIAVENKRKK